MAPLSGPFLWTAFELCGAERRLCDKSAGPAVRDKLGVARWDIAYQNAAGALAMPNRASFCRPAHSLLCISETHMLRKEWMPRRKPPSKVMPCNSLVKRPVATPDHQPEER